MYNIYILIATLIINTNFAFSQKLPDKQSAAVWAPPGIKIDGKTIEWGRLQAFNHATEIFYTISNDRENLYLVIQAIEPNVILRILAGGISFSVQPFKSLSEKNKIEITYPIIEHMPALNFRNKKNVLEDTSKHSKDSIMINNNNLLSKNSKSIGVVGVKGLDSLISVYNTDGVKAAEAFDNKKVYTCEFSVKFELLNLSFDNNSKFSYKIRINGTKSQGIIKALSVTPGAEALMNAFLDKANEVDAQLSAPTDFSAQYSLAKP